MLGTKTSKPSQYRHYYFTRMCDGNKNGKHYSFCSMTRKDSVFAFGIMNYLNFIDMWWNYSDFPFFKSIQSYLADFTERIPLLQLHAGRILIISKMKSMLINQAYKLRLYLNREIGLLVFYNIIMLTEGGMYE